MNSHLGRTKNWKEFADTAKNFLLIAASLYAAYLAIKFLLPVLRPFIIGIFITYILRPVYLWFEKRKLPKTVSLLLTYALFVIFFVILAVIFVPIFISQFKEFIHYIPKIQERLIVIASELKDFISKYGLVSQVETIIQRALSDLSSKAVSILQSVSLAGATVFGFVLNLVLGLIVSIYFLKDWSQISRTIKIFLKGAFGESAVDFITEGNRKIASFIKSQIIVAFITGLLTGMLLYFIGVPLAGFLGVLVALFDLIPYFGPIFAGGIAILLALSVSPAMAFWAFVAVFVAQQIEAMVLAPLVVGKNTEIHPLTILFSLLLGATLFGFIGIIIAVPAAGIFKAWIERNFISEGGSVEEL